ncbi:MAG: HEPN domain-containing protein [Methylobacterium mesophilicum]|nr:HEPN domain-containing protein [Methylobacterium mesophilicum]
MTPDELRLNRIAAFRDLASEELNAARLLARTHRGQSAYFLQQSVKKLARGILELEDTKVGPTHNIAQLAQLISAHEEFADRLRELDELSPAATRYRYPSPSGEVRSIDEARLNRLLAKVEKLNEDVSSVLGAHLSKHQAR